MSFSGLAIRIFGGHTRRKKYPALQENLRKARLLSSADAYAAMAMLSAVLAYIPSAMLGFLIARVFQLGLPLMLMLIVLFSAMFAAVTYQLILSYPSMAASERGRKIDAALPYSAGFMHALSRSGATIADIFRELSTRPDVGEIQKEAKVFRRDVEYLGHDPLTALRDLARTTPSEKFKGFIDVLVSIIETGGETTPYFSTKCLEFQNSLKEENKKTVSTLEFMAEIYVILIAFAPLLFLAIFVFMSILPGRGLDPKLLWIIVYGWIPLGSVMFAILISTTSRVQIKGAARAVRLPSPYREATLVKGDARDRAILSRLRGTQWQMKLKRFLSNPFRILVQSPSYIFLFSAPVAIIYLLFMSAAIDTTTIFFTFVIIFLPYAIAYEFRSKRVEQIDAALPNFLKSLSSASRSGLTLPRAITVASTAELGPLTDEVRRARKDIEWGSSAAEALAEMEQRISVSNTAARATTLIRKASEAEENVSDVVDIVMNDVETGRVLQKERGTAMFIYKIVIILTFAVFLITSYFLIDPFVSAGLQPPTGITVTDLKLVFYHLMLVEGLVGGLLAAQMSGGDMRGGFKYSIAMMLIVWIFFNFYIMPKPVTMPTPVEESFLAAFAL